MSQVQWRNGELLGPPAKSGICDENPNFIVFINKAINNAPRKLKPRSIDYDDTRVGAPPSANFHHAYGKSYDKFNAHQPLYTESL
ncbi:hypothetical protein TNCV_1691321 [Trichonephila clavipes]|nr:hypothetical protein TNCV_1691321 [Trichonephila clavipes]